MRIRICAVGRMRAGPEREMADDYLGRFERLGRSLGLGPAEVREVEARRGGGAAAEAGLLRGAVPEGAVLAVLDERGEALSSREFAQTLARWRDEGRGAAAFAVGGPDGLDPELRADARLVLGFGRMAWPHMLARAMLAEQLYRAASILAGTPYHRE